MREGEGGGGLVAVKQRAATELLFMDLAAGLYVQLQARGRVGAQPAGLPRSCSDYNSNILLD